MSTQGRISPGHLGLGGVTILETHSVGPDTFSMIPSFSNFSISWAILSRIWNGVRLYLRATGGTLLSMCSVTSASLRYPIPSHKPGYLARKSSGDGDELDCET